MTSQPAYFRPRGPRDPDPGVHGMLGRTSGGEAALKSRPADGRDAEIGRLKAKVGELTMANELLDTKIERLETHRPLARRRSRR
jgi:hypothetical protein